MSDLSRASDLLQEFRRGSLRNAIADIESSLVGQSKEEMPKRLSSAGVSQELFLAALLFKRHASQIDNIVHAVGTLMALPHVLEIGEVIESLSLGAGNTGRSFDLETDRRVAEFTFIRWQGGPETVRQDKLFKDFYFLAEADTEKVRELYVIGVDHPTKFLESNRRIASVLHSNGKLRTSFQLTHAGGIATVREYFDSRRHLVRICDLATLVPALGQ
jgi:hypothetical protein